MKPFRNTNSQKLLDLAVAVITVTLVGGGLWINFHHKKSVNQPCDKYGTEITISVQEDTFKPDHMTLRKCDTIKITNTGAVGYELVFGEHDKHQIYPGYSVQSLDPGHYVVIDAVQAGTYTLHDHLRDTARLVLDIKAQ